jgi:hypothetical protein
LAAGFVFDDGHVPKLQAPRFVRPQAGVGREQNIVVKLFIGETDWRFGSLKQVPEAIRGFPVWAGNAAQ